MGLQNFTLILLIVNWRGPNSSFLIHDEFINSILSLKLATFIKTFFHILFVHNKYLRDAWTTNACNQDLSSKVRYDSMLYWYPATGTYRLRSS